MKDLRTLIKKYLNENFKNKTINEEREQFKILYHGTDINSAMNIKKYGVDILKGYGGYFGWGFYTTPYYDLAKSNYAEFSDDEDGGVVLVFILSEKANILDLRDSNDFEQWKPYSKEISNKYLYKELVKNGIDGLWDDSFDGVVIYNPEVLYLKRIIK
jgi:hypothetical protein